MPSYNHARFIGQAIESVLGQSFFDYEFLISDDGSADNTREVVEKYNDPRIRFFYNIKNRGACTIHNELLQFSSGKYIALINSDDVWVEGKLERQVDFLETRPNISAYFGKASFIDEHGDSINKIQVPFGKIFDQKNRPRARWLRFFFDVGNCLCHPTSMIRRECYLKLGGYNNRMRQLPDYDMWIRLVKQYEIHIDDRSLIKFRVLPGENASAATSQNVVRTINEHYLIAAHFFDELDDDTFRQAFHDRFYPGVEESIRDLEIEKTLQYFCDNQWLGGVYKAIGLRRLFEHLNDEDQRKKLYDVYGIDDRNFQKISAEFDAFKPRSVLSSSSDWEIAYEFWNRVKIRARRTLRFI